MWYSRKHCRRRLIIFSSCFPMQSVSVIGRYDAGEVSGLPGLGSGIIMASRH